MAAGPKLPQVGSLANSQIYLEVWMMKFPKSKRCESGHCRRFVVRCGTGTFCKVHYYDGKGVKSK